MKQKTTHFFVNMFHINACGNQIIIIISCQNIYSTQAQRNRNIWWQMSSYGVDKSLIKQQTWWNVLLSTCQCVQWMIVEHSHMHWEMLYVQSIQFLSTSGYLILYVIYYNSVRKGCIWNSRSMFIQWAFGALRIYIIIFPIIHTLWKLTTGACL